MRDTRERGPRSSLVQTYLGPIAADELGLTLIHEHIFVRDPELELNVPGLGWDRTSAVEEAVRSLTALHALGVGTVVDMTVMGLGRDVQLVAEVARRVPLRIIAATGLYRSDGLPLYLHHHGPGRLVEEPEPLVELFVRDIEQGIGGTAIRAGMIKITTEGPELSETDERVLEAAATAHRRTGVPISTHSDPRARNGPLQLGSLRSKGVPPERIVIGHSGDTDDLDYLRAIMDGGATIGLDRFGMEHVLADRARIDTVVALLQLGYAERMVLSHDAAVYSHVTPPAWRAAHAPRWHMEHLSRTILLELSARGVSQEEVDRMLIANPRRLLTPAEEMPR